MEAVLEIKLMDSHDKDNLFDIYARLQEERRLNIFLYFFADQVLNE